MLKDCLRGIESLFVIFLDVSYVFGGEFGVGDVGCRAVVVFVVFVAVGEALAGADVIDGRGGGGSGEVHWRAAEGV